MSIAVGTDAECLAESYLHKQGLLTLEKNYRGRQGEIDLIMQDDDQWVFVEVRFRRAEDYGSPASTVTKQKQRKIINTAKQYLIEKKQYDKVSCRFDVIGISDEIEWIADAFQTRV